MFVPCSSSGRFQRTSGFRGQSHFEPSCRPGTPCARQLRKPQPSSKPSPIPREGRRSPAEASGYRRKTGVTQPEEGQSTEKQRTDEPPDDEQPVDEQSVDEQPEDEQHVDEQPEDEPPVDEQLVYEQVEHAWPEHGPPGKVETVAVQPGDALVDLSAPSQS
jgi:hypothetical protein